MSQKKTPPQIFVYIYVYIYREILFSNYNYYFREIIFQPI